MKDELISLYIDDAMDLDEKIEFVERVHAEPSFRDGALSLLRQETLLRSDVSDALPAVVLSAPHRWRFFLDRAWGYLGAAAAAACLVFFLTFQKPVLEPIPYRFVLYQPDAARVELSGSFTGWKAVPMNRVGDSGYWDVTVPVFEGEHRFSYILDGKESLTDPSIPAREKDDFGGENSILVLGV